MFDCSAMLQVGKSSICCQFLSSEHVNTYARVGEDPRFEDFLQRKNGILAMKSHFQKIALKKKWLLL